jgi:ethanolamine transporter EutH
MLPAAITGKLFSGVLGVIIALMFFKRSEKPEKSKNSWG